MINTPERIDCGDSQQCNDCIHKNNRAEKASGNIKPFVVNAMGRCDFYSGPNKVIYNTAA